MLNIDFGGKTAIVTGGSKGIGREICERLEQAGCNVVSLSRSEGFDITSFEGLNFWKEIKSKYGKVDTLINCAGIFHMRALTRGEGKEKFSYPATRSEIYEMINTNIVGTYEITQLVVENLMKENGGKIVNISSIDAIQGSPYKTVYSMTKGAVISATKSLAVELGRYKINVNCVCPGYVNTEMTHEYHENEKIRKNMINSSPFRRVTTTRHVADLVVYLSSEMSDGLTGQIIAVDNGVTV